MERNVENEPIRELTHDLKQGRLTRGAFMTKALAMGVSLVAADKLLNANPAFAMSRAEHELRASAKTLQYWTPFAGADGPHMGLMVDRYNHAHAGSGYYFNFVRVGGGYETKMTSAAISHTLPDVAAYRLDWIPDAVARGIFGPIDDIAAANHIKASDYVPAVWQGGIQNGHRYSIPLDTHVAVFWWNKDVLGKAGISAPPTNMQEFTTACNAVMKSGKIAYPLSINWPLPLQFVTFHAQNGGHLFNADHSRAAFNDAAGQKALQFMVDVVKKGWSPTNLTDEGNISFLGQKSAMWIDGIWWLQGVKDAKFNFGAGPVPTLFAQPGCWSGSHQMVLPNKPRPAADREAIGKFITYIVQNAAEWAKGGQVPASKTVRDSAEFKAVQPQATIAAEEPYVHFVDPVPGCDQAYYNSLGPLTAAVQGKMGVKEALDTAVANANKILAAAKASFSASGQD